MGESGVGDERLSTRQEQSWERAAFRLSSRRYRLVPRPDYGTGRTAAEAASPPVCRAL